MNGKLRRKLYSASPTLLENKKKINTKLYLIRTIVTIKNNPLTPAVLDNSSNMLVYYTFTVF